MTWNELLLDVENYMERYRNALEQIVNAKNIKDPEILRALALSALDGEPTTADEFNMEDENDTPKQSKR
mgnify:CR=1 FL=1|tara:strand:- start:156 stop:362 length:207 start_codon:yes stop_codon:yes gene_type:complete